MFRIILISIGVVISLVSVSCQGEKEVAEASTDKLNVVCTIGMISDVAEQVGGEYVEVTNLIGTGLDPHVYKHTASDVKRLQAADIIFYNGLHLEGKMGEILEKLAEKGKPVFPVAQLALEDNQVIHEAGGEADPHVWMDVNLWRKVSRLIGDQLSQLDPDNTDRYIDGIEAYDQRLITLDKYCKQRLATIPESQRELVTAHDAFGYMERAYGLRVRGVQGISTGAEAGLKDVNELIDHLISKKIPSVFIESSVNDKSVRALQEGAKAKGHVVTIGGELFSDAMGAPGTYEGTYIGMIDHNVTKITQALGGKAAPKGMSGQLAE